jgi:hypothetical protein
MAISTVRKDRDEARAGAKPSDVVNVRRNENGAKPMLSGIWPDLGRSSENRTKSGQPGE